MSTKKLAILVAVAVVLAVAASFLRGGARPSAPKLTGKAILPNLPLADVARVEAGGVTVAATDAGWVVETMQNYPADRAKILANLQKLQDLKVGQVAKGRELKEKTPVVLRNADGKELASVVLGERHPKWGFGRYAEFEGETVLVGDMLDAFDGDPKRWCETKIVDTPWISFTSLAEPDIADEATGFSTGVVAMVTIAGDTNRVATVGNALPDGSGRYLRLEGEPWTFIVPTYSVERLLPKEEKPEAPEAPAEAPVVEPIMENTEATEKPEAPAEAVAVEPTTESTEATEIPTVAPTAEGKPEAETTTGSSEAPAPLDATP